MRQLFIKSGLVLAGILFVSFVSIVSASAAGISTDVTVNRSSILSLKKPVDRVTIATQGIADIVVISPRQIQINGISIGKTSLIIWEEGSEKPIFYDVRVTGDLASIEEQIKELAPKDNISVQFASDSVILSGTAGKEQTRIKAEEIAKAFTPKVINHIQLGEPLQVLLQVKVAQIDRTILKNLGIKTIIKGSTENSDNKHLSVSGSAGNGLSATNIFGLAVPAADGIQLGMSYFKGGIGSSLSALVDKGYAKILAEPNLLVKSQPPIKSGVKVGTGGEKQICSGESGYACFLAGKQYPYISSIDTNGAKQWGFKDVGVKLVFHAEVLENGLINLKIAPASVSAVIGFVENQPILDAREVHTEVELGDSQSLVLAGLLSEEAVKHMSKIPLLGDIPVLGALFRSTSDDIKEKELVFFVTPKIVKPAKATDESKFIVKEGEKFELPGAKIPVGLEERDIKVPPELERDLKWVPLVK